jgi:DNA polymerase/3'-5' exonuclease PolX
MQLEKARDIAEQVKHLLEESCERIEIAGSIRRLKSDVGDVELLCIPKFNGFIDSLDQKVKSLVGTHYLDYRLNKLGRQVYGPKNKLMRHVESGLGIDISCTNEECWWVSLVVRTGGKQTNIDICTAALQRGYKFHAYGSGFSTPHGDIVCRSEREAFETVGLAYREPWQRN